VSLSPPALSLPTPLSLTPRPPRRPGAPQALAQHDDAARRHETAADALRAELADTRAAHDRETTELQAAANAAQRDLAAARAAAAQQGDADALAQREAKHQVPSPSNRTHDPPLPRSLITQIH
jgi:hypothetical protein